ncbi:MAG: hypothetical protein IT342_23035 [Candidatus Melainabacteria bacterium]|nr:hypothetical protein [Candidatus Melainabacteria bacterium]
MIQIRVMRYCCGNPLQATMLSFSRQILKFATSKWLIIAISLLVVGCNTTSKTETTTTNTETAEKTQPTTAGSEKTEQPGDKTAVELPGEKTDSKELSAKVLMRPDFIGRVKMAYMSAKEIPALAQKLFCYCGCDYTDEHTSLLDCYTCDHSVDCDYCKGEIMMAFKMNRKGASVAEIQKAIDLNWGPHYPFYEQPSDAIKKYWKKRLWAPGAGPTKFEHPNETKPIIDPFTGTSDSKSKPMSKKGDCCGGKKKSKESK